MYKGKPLCHIYGILFKVIKMRMKKVNIEDIIYINTDYPISLLESIERIGLSFALKVSYRDGKYICLDGHKRLSAIHDLINAGKTRSRITSVNVIVMNDGSIRSNDCWNGRNSH